MKTVYRFILFLSLFWVFFNWEGTLEGAEIEKGKKVYKQKRCHLCHIIGGEGGKGGSDLSEVGKTRDREWLRKFLVNPKETVPGAKMLPIKATEEELTALLDYLMSLDK